MGWRFWTARRKKKSHEISGHFFLFDYLRSLPRRAAFRVIHFVLDIYAIGRENMKIYDRESKSFPIYIFIAIIRGHACTPPIFRAPINPREINETE